MSSILFAGVTTEYTPTLPTRGKKQLCFINIYSMWVCYCRRKVACVAWRFWLGALSNKGGRGQRNREEIFLAATPLLRPARQNRHATQARRKGTDAQISFCNFLRLSIYSFIKGSGPLSRDWSNESRTNTEPVTNWKNISLTFHSEFLRDLGKSSFFPDLFLSVVSLVSDLKCPCCCCCWFTFFSKARSRADYSGKQNVRNT